MTLLPQVLRPWKAVHIRRADYVAEQNECILQIWGNEGYWHIVDREFGEFLQLLEAPRFLREVFREHPNCKPHQRAISAQLHSMAKSGLGAPTPPPRTEPAIENLTINLVTACNLHCQTCYVPDDMRNGAKLNVDQVVRFLEDLRPCLSHQATLSLLGGRTLPTR